MKNDARRKGCWDELLVCCSERRLLTICSAFFSCLQCTTSQYIYIRLNVMISTLFSIVFYLFLLLLRLVDDSGVSSLLLLVD